MDRARQASAESLLQETNCLLSLPEVCLKLREVLADPGHTRQEITEIIALDPALTTRLLRIVNSSYYGLASPVNNIPHALGMLGEYDLHNLIIVTSIVQTMNTVSTELDIKRFWKESVFSAVLSRNIAKKCNVDIKEELFIAGLLLNVGKLLIYANEPDLLAEVESQIENSDKQDFIIERELLGFDHSDVGAILAKNWNFSKLLSETISAHHELPELQSSSVACQITYLASYCSDAIDLATVEYDEKNTPNVEMPDCTQNLNISEDDFTSLLVHSHNDYLQAYEAFCGGQ